MTADFSKIEQRLLAAHIDQKIIHGWHYQMAKAVAEDQDDRTSASMRRDFYTEFAAEAYGVPKDKVTEEMRAHVKALFWASLYGADS